MATCFAGTARYAAASGRLQPSAAMVWIGGCAPLRAWQDGQASSDSGIRAGYQKSPIRRCFKPRTPLSAGIAGFASGCRSHEQENEIAFLGGCPASCPDAHRSTHGHRHVRKRAITGIIQPRRESTIYRAPTRAHPPLEDCGGANFLRWCAPEVVQRTSTFLNCQGSRLSMSSGNRPGRPSSGVQSV
jgi:hypothetical protein